MKSQRTLTAIELHCKWPNAPVIASVFLGEDGVGITEHSWFTMPDTGKPYPINRGVNIFRDPARLMALLGHAGAPDLHALLAALDRRAREDSDALLSMLIDEADSSFDDEYHSDSHYSEWDDVQVVMFGAPETRGGSELSSLQ